MSNIKFVNTWMDAVKRGGGVQSVASKLGIEVTTASAKANYLRKQGVKLPPMTRTRNEVFDVDRLNALIESKA